MKNPLIKGFKDFKTWMYNGYGNNPAKMLVHTGTLGWILSSLAQIGAVVFNDKIPKEQKAFLIPQEIADAGVNILSFYLITNSLKNFANKLVSSGKIVNTPIKKFLLKLKSKGVIENTSGLKFNIENLPVFGQIKSEYTPFKNGVSVIASTLGSIFSCNILTPIARNSFASDRQQISIAKMNANAPKPIVKPQRGLTIAQFKTMSLGGDLKI